MGSIATYLNFPGTTEEAFTFYSELFGNAPRVLQRFSDVSYGPPLNEEERHYILNVQLEILGGHVLMGSDMLTSLGHECRVGNNTTLVLEVDSRAEADHYYDALSQDSTENRPMGDMPWGGYWGVCLDRFGIRWMISHTPAAS